MDIETKLKYNDKVPHNFVNLSQKAKFIDDAHEDETKLNDAIKFLGIHGIPCKTLDQIKTITSASVKDYIDTECKKFLSASAFIPIALQNETKLKYWDAYTELEPYCNIVSRLNTKYQGIGLEADEEGTWHFNTEDLERVATEKATTHIQKIYRDAYAQYKELAEALKKCHQWELDNHFAEVTTYGHKTICAIKEKGIYDILFGAFDTTEPTDFTPEKFINMIGRVFYPIPV